MPLIKGPCSICGEQDYELSMGGPEICPACDCGDFGIVRLKRQAELIRDLRERLAVAERQPRIDAAIARQLSESIALNSHLRLENARFDAMIANAAARLAPIKQEDVEEEFIKAAQVFRVEKRSRWRSDKMTDLNPQEVDLLKWLGEAEYGQYGECYGASLNRLIELGLAQVHPSGEHQNFIANDFAGTKGIMYRAVSLTDAGLTRLATETGCG